MDPVASSHTPETDEIVFISSMSDSMEEEVQKEPGNKKRQSTHLKRALEKSNDWLSADNESGIHPTSKKPASRTPKKRINIKKVVGKDKEVSSNKEPNEDNRVVNTNPVPTVTDKPQTSNQNGGVKSNNSVETSKQMFFFRVVPVNPLASGPRQQQQQLVNGRSWKYATILNADISPRRPLHPEEVGQEKTRAHQQIMSQLASNNVQITPVSSKEHGASSFEQFAVCAHCGQLSRCFTRCDFCKTVLPQPVKVHKKSVMKDLVISGNSWTSLTKQKFYGSKLAEHYQALGGDEHQGEKIFSSSGEAKQMKKTRTKGQEPECLTLSSDDEDSKENTSVHSQVNSGSDDLVIDNNSEFFDDKMLTQATSTIFAQRTERMRDKDGNLMMGAPVAPSSMQHTAVAVNLQGQPVITESVAKTNQSSAGEFSLSCRSIRVGSFRVHAEILDLVSVNKDSLTLKLPTLSNSDETVTLTLQTEDIVRVLAHFGDSLPVLFIYSTPVCGTLIRNHLCMDKKLGPFYDPGGRDETQKRITVLPHEITNEQRLFFRTLFLPGKVEEIDQKTANEILVRSTPVNMAFTNNRLGKLNALPVATRSSNLLVQSGIAAQCPSEKPVKKLLVYPPPPQTGGITITNEDLECLAEGEFLNDVILDFYLKYIIMEKLSEEDRQRTHIFSSFFYPRLTANPGSKPLSEEEASMTVQERRHNRVKKWTRHVDIFQKEFIIVPINQNHHWFLAIICFSGLVKDKVVSSAKSTGETEPSPASSPGTEQQANSSMTIQEEEPIGVTSGSDPKEGQLEMEEPESPLPAKKASPNLSTEEQEDPIPKSQSPSEHKQGPAKSSSNPDLPKKEPCILVFDSLLGPARWRIVATLREYLACEWKAKKGATKVFDRDTMRGYTPRVPQQTNFSDCGLYVLQYTESFFENPLPWFGRPMPCLDDWFHEEKVMGKRAELKDLILQIHKQQASQQLLTTPKSHQRAQPLLQGTCPGQDSVSKNNNPSSTTSSPLVVSLSLSEACNS
ncbi:sentrin-specific protease 6-like isoform X1 [Limulus polyphemus]|uniref:Sentrin-specific protease 6-like isoform X1 n=2 Tax=Limulus polyphemus TaxID=6850 RepID=A0ABM1B7R8_LIMPO|nr:sentrin-specific protease 6-like isoform X1 [Limulus polyphemus]